jgi:hypothetical protein
VLFGSAIIVESASNMTAAAAHAADPQAVCEAVTATVGAVALPAAGEAVTAAMDTAAPPAVGEAMTV